ANGGYTLNSPTSLWWVQLATAVVCGLGLATVLTLVFTPAALAVRVWAVAGAYGAWFAARAAFGKKGGLSREDWRLARAARKTKTKDLVWSDVTAPTPIPAAPPRAAE
ncbi:MAG: hypothetical protein AAGA78_09020, partial [Pseudomonadota bacterium]